MISLIICSRNSAVLEAVSQNIAISIGVEYEVIAIDNSKGQYSICEAYNLGASQAHFGLLCFMHEDIRFHTMNWGNIVIDTLADLTIGVLGVTGGMYQLAAPAAWWGCGLDLCRENVLNVFEDGHTEMELRNPENATLTDVAVVDGMWMCSRKEIWMKYPFDAQTFTDFHFYDVDYCTEVFKRGLRVCVTFQLILEHHSRGSVNAMWIRNALKYRRKRHKELPFGPISISTTERQKIELHALQEFTGRLIRGKFSAQLIAAYLGRCLALAPFNRDTLWLAKMWIRGMHTA